MFDLLLREGRVVAPEGQLLALDVGVIDGRIAALGPDVTAPAGQVVSARGCLVLPGVIDLHTHLRSPQGEAGLFTGETASAVAGGVTLVGDFAYPPGSRFELDFAAKRARLAQEAVCDFVLHTVVRSAEDLQRAGTYTVKVFFTASGLGAQTQGALALLQEAVAAGHQVLAHVESLPDYLAILQHGLQAGPGRVHILHVAHQRLVGAVAAFQEPRVTMETCPHYLLWEWVRGRPGCTVNPPVVPADLWPAVRAGQIGTIGTDHCSYTWAEKETLGLPGFPATEQLLRLIATAGVQAGRISWADLLRLLCSGPARVLGLYPRKGALQVGSDADLVLFDPAAEEELGKPAYGRGDFSPYAGLRVFGRVVRTMVRGRTVYADGVADMSAAGWGRWQDAQGI